MGRAESEKGEADSKGRGARSLYDGAGALIATLVQIVAYPIGLIIGVFYGLFTLLAGFGGVGLILLGLLALLGGGGGAGLMLLLIGGLAVGRAGKGKGK